MGPILVQTVGTGETVSQALAFTIRARQPRLVVFVCTETSRDKTLPGVTAALDGGMPEHRVELIDDSDNVDVIADRCGQVLDGLAAESPGVRLEVDFTSGTKPMSAGIVAAAVGRRVARLLYATGPRDADGRVTETTGVRTLVPASLTADRELAELGELFNRGQFAAVQVAAERLSGELEAGTRLHDRAASLEFMARAYRAWDLFKWGEANNILSQIRSHERQLKDSGWTVDTLHRQKDFLESAARRDGRMPPSPERLVDLLASAERCHRRGRFDDAVARLYRLVEYVLQGSMCDHGVTDPKQPDRQILEKLAPAWYAKNKGRTSLKLGLRDLSDVLCEADDDLAKWLNATPEPPAKAIPRLRNELNARNESLLGHGTTPVREETSSSFIEIGEEAVERYCKVVADTGTSYEDLREAATFCRCPWRDSR